MPNIPNIFKFINNRNTPMNILANSVDKKYLSELTKLEHNFFTHSIDGDDEVVENVNVPKGAFSDTLNYDVIIVGSRFNNAIHEMKQLSHHMNCQLIVLDFVYPWNFSQEFSSLEDIPKRFIEMLKQTNGDLHISCSDEIGKAWSNFCTNNITIPYSESGYDNKNFTEAWSNILKEIKEKI